MSNEIAEKVMDLAGKAHRITKKRREYVQDHAPFGATDEMMARHLKISVEDFLMLYSEIKEDAITEMQMKCAKGLFEKAENGDKTAQQFLLKQTNWNPKGWVATAGNNKRDARIVVGNPTGRRQAVLRKEITEAVMTWDN